MGSNAGLFRRMSREEERMLAAVMPRLAKQQEPERKPKALTVSVRELVARRED